MYNFFVRGRLIINLPAASSDGIRHLLLGRRLVFFLEMLLQEHKNYAQQLNLLYITPQADTFFRPFSALTVLPFFGFMSSNDASSK